MSIKPIHFRKLVKVFEKDGWIYQRTKGDHLIYQKKGFTRPIVIPKYKTIPIFLLKIILKPRKFLKKNILNYLKK